MQAYWEEKDELTQRSFDNTNWEASKQALKEQPKGMRRWFCKHCTRWCGVGRSMFLRKEWDHNRCIQCGKEEETTVHMVKCNHLDSANETWKEAMTRLEEHLKKQKTDPDLTAEILAALNHWRSGKQRTRSRQLHTQLRRALEEQDKIGWYNFQLGRISKRLTAYQQDYYRRQGSQKTGLRWTVALIHKLMATAWDMWEHRNSILHGASDDYHTRRETAKADREISKEFLKGKQDLLRRHKHLLRSKRQVLRLELMDKHRWLESVQGARKAWQHHKDSMPSYEGERRGMENFLEEANPGITARWARNNNNHKNRGTGPRTPGTR